MGQVVVVGGGAAGAAAARVLAHQGHDVTIVEQRARLGGRIRTERFENLIFEAGAGFLTDLYPRTFDLVGQLNLNDHLRRVSTRGWIMRDGAPRRISVRDALAAKLFSPVSAAKLAGQTLRLLPHWRQLNPVNLWRAAAYDTQTTSEWLGDSELLHYVMAPALDGYLYWQPERTSAAAARSVLRSALRPQRRYILTNGLTQLVSRAASRCKLLLHSTVDRITRLTNGRYEVMIHGDDGKHVITADGVVCATPASAVPHLVRDLNQRQRSFFGSVTYSATALVAFVMRGGARAQTFAIPAKENAELAAITITSPVSAPGIGEHSIVKLFASGAVGEQLVQGTDAEIIQTLMNAAQRSDLGLKLSNPLARRVYRWPQALPEFPVGYIRSLAELEQEPLDSGRLVFAGDYLVAPFIEGAVASGQAAGTRLAQRLSALT